jgi:hypothetical protein
VDHETRFEGDNQSGLPHGSSEDGSVLRQPHGAIENTIPSTHLGDVDEGVAATCSQSKPPQARHAFVVQKRAAIVAESKAVEFEDQKHRAGRVCGAKTPSTHQVALPASRWPVDGIA